MISKFDDNKTGLVAATIRGKGAKNIPSLMENLHLNAFLASSVFASAKLAKIAIVIGKAILIPRELLERIGGFEAFKYYLAEDYMMGISVADLGYEVKTTNVFVENINENLSLKKFLNRHSRWAKMRAKIRLNTYLLEALSNPIATSFILGVALHNEFGLYQFLSVSLLKSVIDLVTLSIMKSDIKWYQASMIPLKDLIIGILWYVPFLNTEVTWRENSFRIEKDSLLQPILTDN
jgi:ceramide glucosyltransferase